ncbi:GDSL esterase/lipase 1-like [Cornus florida]|uniref:GDSL esterase/lipase 1-like n=1 Tax=Cornus florida TaxID=4283 RepID=UPI00289C5644|nr:GDSL esterase/lipase 1-like [Cornus florida]
MATLSFFCCLLLPFASLLLQVGCTDDNYKHAALFIFGDSLYDAGNSNYINTTTGFQANFRPYGESFFKYPTGRFSDGRLIPDFIAEYAKLPLIPPYLQPNNHYFVYGANFASSGAGALAEIYPGYVIDLNTQLSNFKKVEKLWRMKLGDTEAEQMLLNAVYMFAFGANDYINYPFLNSSYSEEEYVDLVVGNLTQVFKEIYKKGGRKFGIYSLGSYENVPGIRILTCPTNVVDCKEVIAELVKQHNKALSKTLHKLEKKLKGFMYSNFMGSIGFGEIIDNPTKYGFKVGNSACCGSGLYRGINSCGGKRGVEEYELCENPSEYVFFDSDHPTEAANQHVAKLMWSGNTDVAMPYNVKALFQHTQG